MLEVKKSQAEITMNAMANLGWKVVSVTYWNYWSIKLIITFEREYDC